MTHNTVVVQAISMSDSDVMYAFTKGLQPRLKEWVLHNRPETLKAAIEIVVRMSGSDKSHTSASANKHHLAHQWTWTGS